MTDASNPDAVTLRMAASPAEVWAVVSDPTGYGRLSPECTGGRWLDGATPMLSLRLQGAWVTLATA